MATVLKYLCLLALWSCHLLLVQGRWLFHMRPQRTELCPSKRAGEENVCYDIVTTNFTCSSITRDVCSTKRNRLMQIKTSYGPCNNRVERTCQNFMCHEKCCDGWQRDADGKCLLRTGNGVKYCWNGGTVQGDKCICPDHYTGSSCETPVCDVVCSNGGECKAENKYSKPRCVCPSNFTGEGCESAVCGDGCLNGGLCVTHNSESVCECTAGYAGSRCEIAIRNIKCSKCYIHDKYNTNCTSQCVTDSDCANEEHCCELNHRKICVFRSNYSHQRCLRPNEHDVPVGTTFWNEEGRFCRCMVDPDPRSWYGTTDCYIQSCSASHSLQCLNSDHGNVNNQSGLPSNYHKPYIRNCPREGEIVAVYVDSDSNKGTLSHRFVAYDWEGQGLYVDAQQHEYRACNCSSPTLFDNKAITEPDKYDKTSTCCFKVKVIDRHPPVFTSCPPSIFALYNERVYWKKPEAIDNVGIRSLRMRPDVLNGSFIFPGSNIFQYIAEDWAGNIAICKFYVRIVGSDTDEDNWPNGLHNRMEKSNTSVIIGGCVVGVLAILLLVLIAVIFRVCRKRTKRLRGMRAQAARNRSSQPRNQNDNTVFTVFGTDPPPYEIAAKDKLPEYTPRDDPPGYEEANITVTGKEQDETA